MCFWDWGPGTGCDVPYQTGKTENLALLEAFIECRSRKAFENVSQSRSFPTGGSSKSIPVRTCRDIQMYTRNPEALRGHARSVFRWARNSQNSEHTNISALHYRHRKPGLLCRQTVPSRPHICARTEHWLPVQILWHRTQSILKAWCEMM